MKCQYWLGYSPLGLGVRAMFVKIGSEGQVTLPKRVLNMLRVGPGDHLEIEKGPDGLLLRPRYNDECDLDELDGTGTTDADVPMLDLVTVRTGKATSWNRDEIYGDDGR